MPGGEGGPWAEEAVWYAGLKFLQKGRILHGLLIFLSFDCHLRSQDWAKLAGCGVTCDRRSVALVFGVSRRGQEVKTGINQGVVISRGWLAEMMAVEVSLVDPHAAVFPFTAAAFRKDVQRLWEKGDVEGMRAIHDLRHSGAASDVASGRQDLEGARRRGRWRHMSGVQRYGKTHLLVSARAKVGPRICAIGQKFMENPREAIIQAINSGPGRKTAEGRAIVRRLRQGPFMEDTAESLRPGNTSPRVQPQRGTSKIPEALIDQELQMVGRSTRGSREAKEIALQEVYRAPVEAWNGHLDSDDETIGELTEEEDCDEQVKVTEEMDEDEETRRRKRGRRKNQKTARYHSC